MLSDVELLSRLGLPEYEIAVYNPENTLDQNRYLFLTEDSLWTHLMDDWVYNLWHHPELRDNIKKLSLNFDIFTCSTGDADYSFDFTYYINGEIKREYMLDDHPVKGSKVTKNWGKPLAGEEEAFSCPKIEDKVLSIAQSLGVNLNHQKEKIRSYGKLATDLYSLY